MAEWQKPDLAKRFARRFGAERSYTGCHQMLDYEAFFQGSDREIALDT